jgi:hypothetical protein
MAGGGVAIVIDLQICQFKCSKFLDGRGSGNGKRDVVIGS